MRTRIWVSLAAITLIVSACGGSSGSGATSTTVSGSAAINTLPLNTTTTAASNTTTSTEGKVTGAPADATDVTTIEFDFDRDGSLDHAYAYLTADLQRTIELVMGDGADYSAILPGPPDTAPIAAAALDLGGDSATLLVESDEAATTKIVELYQLVDGALAPVNLSDETTAEFALRNQPDLRNGVGCKQGDNTSALAVLVADSGDGVTFDATTTLYAIEGTTLVAQGAPLAATLTSPQDDGALAQYSILDC
jgi:hypothetical protein